MILYFSGTGNSQYGAKVIGEILKEQIDSINSYMKKDMFPTFQSDTPYVIVMPVYAWKIPRVVETFLKRCTFKGNRKMYFVITCGENIGSADVYAEKLCLEISMEYGGTSDIPMPENFIAMFQVPPEQKCKEMMESARKKLENVADLISEGKVLQQDGKRNWMLSTIVNPLFYKFSVKADKFYAKDNCIGCGICDKVCPLNNIIMKDRKPQWGKECTQCMACISRCPVEAIEYGKKTIGKRRYVCPQYQGRTEIEK